MKPPIFIPMHTGLGDHLITNAIVRHFAREHELVVVPVKHRNLNSVAWMFHDLPNVAVKGVINDECQRVFMSIWKHSIFGIGHFAHPFVGAIFDQEFYRQAGIPFKERWDGFRFLGTGKAMEMFERYEFSMPFRHEDSGRGMAMDSERLSKSSERSTDERLWNQPDPKRFHNIFDYVPLLQAVPEIHCINSSFALLVDSIDLPQNPKLFLHLYARPGGEVPTFKKDWIAMI